MAVGVGRFGSVSEGAARRVACTQQGCRVVTPEEAAATTDPVAFARFVSRGRWQTAPHLDFVADKLRDVASGGLDRLLVFAPPRHGKSELLNVAKVDGQWHYKFSGVGEAFSRRHG